MGAAIHPTAQTQRGKSVNTSVLLPATEGYDRWAPNYDETPNPVIAREERYLEPFLQSVRDKNVLDLACGTGRWLQKAVAMGVQFGVGMDRSHAMLSVAQKKISIQGRLINADCLRLPFHSSVFDLVICSFALSHISHLGVMARELVRVVRPQGEVFVSDLHPEAYTRGWRTGFRDASFAVQIEAFPRSREEVIQTFQAEGVDCLANETLHIGEPERSIFARAGKQHVFDEVVRIPAVLVCRFKRCCAEL
jgi:ubiquinone/menaquinone biosynthesis C-methylase UbiE